MPQNLDDIDVIVKHKVHAKVNKKTYQDMKKALDNIETNKKTDQKIAIIGLAILLPILYLFASTYL